MTVHPIVAMNGAHELNRVSFDNVRVPVTNRIGEEGKGWHYANVLLGSERLSYAHIGKKKADMKRLRALAQSCSGDAGGSMLDDANFAAKIAALEIRIDCIEVSVLRGLCGELSPAAAAFPDLNDPQWASLLSSTPAFAPRAMDSYLFERAQSIYGGTNEIQKNIIWKALSRH